MQAGPARGVSGGWGDISETITSTNVKLQWMGC